MSRIVNSISGRLSLRTPQRRSLEILDRVMEIAQPHKNGDAEAALSVIRSEFPSVEEFERAFPNLCFSLATGVGKTRLMGAFIAYLHLEHGIRHFFVLAPNLTIYNKLKADFTLNSPKYVFQGIAEFAVRQPQIITGEDYERSELLLRTDPYDVTVFVFNISKFNTRSDDARKTRRLSEYLGTSFMKYLASLDDLVLIMDEAHRYRADTSMKSIEELKPVLGLELTATPQVEAGSRSTRFKNVIFDYPLFHAMRDGYVKEPAVATRANFNPGTMKAAELERLKLEDGIRVHESAKVDLDVYAQQNNVRRVKPFMLVIATDTDHANALVKLMEDDAFFDGRYKGRVIQVHSGQKGSEKDENVERLLAVERTDEPTEIVVHVNMLKEGWDVTNLYTIVPLRAADSRTLVEQSIGRGLRLPYGKRTGVPAVDRLTIVAHDRFQDIVDEAKKGGYSFSTIKIGEDVPDTPKQTVMVPPVYETLLGISPVATTGEPGESVETGTSPQPGAPEPKFKTPEHVQVAELTMKAIQRVVRDAALVPGPQALQTEEVQERLIQQVTDMMSGPQVQLYEIPRDELAGVIQDTTRVFVERVIAIPHVIVLPKGEVRAGFKDFTLDMSSFRQPAVSKEILIRHLVGETQEVIGALDGGHEEARLEDYVVRALIDFDDVNYDDQAELLYKLAGQVVAHLRSYLKDEDEVRNVLIFHQRQIADLVHAQMRQHAWEEASSYEAVVSQGFSEVRTQAFSKPADESVRRFDVPLDNKADIRSMLFGGFKKCLYAEQKFDSDPERRLAVILERDPAVRKWFKPGKGVFQIRYTPDSDYEPDFVVETETEKLLCEPKRADQMRDETVLAKARAAATWCEHATTHELAHKGGKPWRYLLIPHDAIADNMTLDGLAKRFAFAAPEDGK